jgi:hypothetical protein
MITCQDCNSNIEALPCPWCPLDKERQKAEHVRDCVKLYKLAYKAGCEADHEEPAENEIWKIRENYYDHCDIRLTHLVFNKNGCEMD